MIIPLFYITLFINILMVFLKRRSSAVLLLTAIVAVYIYFVSTGSADYATYDLVYTGAIPEESFEPGYRFLMAIGRACGLDFVTFQGIICTVCLVIIIWIFRKFSRNYHLFFALYFLYQFFYDICVIRNHIGLTILFIALVFLYRKKRISYLICIAIACLFHKMIIFYTPFVLIDFGKKKHIGYLKKIAIASICLSLLVFVALRNTDLLLKIVDRLPIINKVQLTYFSTVVRLGFIPHYAVHIVNFMLVATIGRRTMRIVRDKSYYKLFRFCYGINLYVFISFPFMLYSIPFFRLFNGIYLFNYIFFAVTLRLNSRNKNRYRKMFTGILLANAMYCLPWIHAAEQRYDILNNVAKIKSGG